MTELRRSARVASRSSTTQEEPATVTQPPVKKAKVESNGNEKTNASAADYSEDSSEIQIGDNIPDITLLNQDNKEVNLSSVAADHKYVVIFAYPKASTPGCTRQVCGFQKNYKFLHDNNVAVFGLSADEPKAQKSFQTKQGAEYDLLSDPKKELIGVLGAKKQPTGTKRSHWIFKDGALVVKKIQISPEQSIDGAKEEIEKYIAEEGEENGSKEDGASAEKDTKTANGQDSDAGDAATLKPEAGVGAQENGGYEEDVEDDATLKDPIVSDAVKDVENKAATGEYDNLKKEAAAETEGADSAKGPVDQVVEDAIKDAEEKI
ncbi:conserved hypothetical protein [Lodderomyces elongisporus NRRL YB-4239]|uniref:thioredoxin-dependent peroxiredoxin n=1 Tax=Lodderomyces elongisporus (strain ATCC 11503 / CBS 2605 / JCM 1781 / NBRC 1676 / NRRL YB-4239) TaxID=379508 RepID=A5DY22_LODEL|nr:conserved hypothetical protein [Lodderomyces elongisporus NRRL YB-4239]